MPIFVNAVVCSKTGNLFTVWRFRIRLVRVPATRIQRWRLNLLLSGSMSLAVMTRHGRDGFAELSHVFLHLAYRFSVFKVVIGFSFKL